MNGTDHFNGSGDTPLFTQNWLPNTPAKAVLAIVHGAGEHSGRYENLVDFFVPRSYILYSFDLRGHGQSPGQRGHINAWEEYREDVYRFLQYVTQQKPSAPVFVIGHSLGGLIVLEAAMNASLPVQGIIASAPALGSVGIAPILWRLARLLDRFWPRFSLRVEGFDSTLLSRDLVSIDRAEKDPFTHNKATARLAVEFEKARAWSNSHPDRLRQSVLILHGTADKLISVDGSRSFFKKLELKDKKLIEYEGGYHELHNDIIKEQVLSDIENWIEQHLNANGLATSRAA